MKEGKIISFICLILHVICFITLILIMKRASILLFIVGTVAILFLFNKNEFIKINKVKMYSSLILIVISMGAILSYYTMTHEDIVEKRFTDVDRYEKSGDVGNLGAGRASLMQYYIKAYLDEPLIQQMLGVDLSGHIEKRRGFFLNVYGANPHDDYLEFLIRNGALGLIAFLMFLYITSKSVMKAYKMAQDVAYSKLCISALAVLIMYICSSVLDSTFGRIVPMTCFALLIGSAIGTLTNRTN